MIRWSYLIPRLVLLAVIVLAVWLGLDPLLRWALISLGERAIAAKVEIGQLSTSLASTEVCLRNVRVANPQGPMRNLFEAAEIRLSLEPNPLLQRKFVVREGRVSGLCFSTVRATPGTVDRKPGLLDLLPDGLGGLVDPGRLEELGQAWLDRLALTLKREITEEVEQLQSVKLARELSRRWPAELAKLESRAEEMKARADRVRELAQKKSDNPVQALENARKIASEIESLQRDLTEFRSEAERLRQQADRDRDAAIAARDQDLNHLRAQFRLDELDSGGLSEALLGHEMNERVRTVVAWICWVRNHLPRKHQEHDPIRARGVDVTFAGLAPRPDFLIRTLTLEGEGSVCGERLQFEGTAQGLTPQPEVYGQPTVLSLAVQGPAAMQIEAVLDHTQPVARDYVSVECPSLAQPKRLLGRPDQLAVTVSPGGLRISLRLELVGDELSGRLSVRQEPVELVPELAAAYGGPQLAGKLQEALRSIRTLEATAELGGTLQRPEWKLRSSLGTQLAQAVQGLLGRELEARRDEALHLVATTVDGEVARFQKEFLAKQQDFVAKLERNGMDVRQLQSLAARPAAAPLDRVLDKTLLKGNPLRF
jgi:uncharacterized protein (TIGR03545 family)